MILDYWVSLLMGLQGIYDIGFLFLWVYSEYMIWKSDFSTPRIGCRTNAVIWWIFLFYLLFEVLGFFILVDFFFFFLTLIVFFGEFSASCWRVESGEHL